MSDRFLFAYIGAGSFRFSLGFFQNIMNAKELFPLHVNLCDIDEKSLEIMGKIFGRMVKKANAEGKITYSLHKNYEEALVNADFVYKSISVGIQDAEWYDNYLPQKFGIPQNTGDTLGPGGIFRGFRTNHVAADIAKTMKKVCPKAPILNYTNPQSSIVMAARREAPGIEYIGLCHELFGGMGTLRAWYNEKFPTKVNRWEDFNISYGGINHFCWLIKFEYNNEDLYPSLRDDARKLTLSNFKNRGFNFHLLEKYGYYPYPGSRHVAEFMTDYYNYFNHKIQSPYWRFPKLRDVKTLSKARKGAYLGFKLMANKLLGVPGPRKEGERAMEMTIDYVKSNPTHHVVNLPNNGIIKNLPNDSIVEIPGRFKDGKMIPAVEPFELPKEVADLVRPYAEQTRYTVDAALGNSLELCVKAMKHDPMCRWIEDDEKIEALTKLMLYYEQQWLPESWKEWIPKKEELEKSKYWVSEKELKKIYKVKFPPNPDLKKKAFFWTD